MISEHEQILSFRKAVEIGRTPERLKRERTVYPLTTFGNFLSIANTTSPAWVM